MAAKLTVPERVRRPLAILAEHAAKLYLLQEAFESLEPEKQTPAFIAEAFASKANIPIARAKDIVTQALSLHGLRIDLAMSPNELFQTVTDSLESESPASWKTDNLQKWKSAKDAIEKILDPNHPLSSTYKTIQLLYDHQNIVYDSNIIADIRPVFDDSARNVRRMLISYVLEIEYSDGQQRRKLFAALDSKDVATLRKACERAETKAATLKEALKGLGWPVVVSGDYSD